MAKKQASKSPEPKTPANAAPTKRTVRRPNPPPAVVISPGAGRPTVYKPEFNELVYRLGLLGHTDEECARFFGISVQGLYDWDKAHPDFLASRARARESADGHVAESLFKRALGYSHPDVHVSNYQGYVTLTDITKHYAPDTQAATWWLKNRQPEKWRDKSEIEHSGSALESLLAQLDDEDGGEKK